MDLSMLAVVGARDYLVFTTIRVDAYVDFITIGKGPGSPADEDRADEYSQYSNQQI
jgi:hypothetical protein